MKKRFKYLGIGLLLLTAVLLGIFWTRDIPVEELKAKYAPPPSAFVEVMGMPVHYRDEGPKDQKLPIVLLHGTGSSLHTWEPTVAQLKDQYRVITMDLPGFGLTGPSPQRDYTPAFYQDFITRFLETLKVDSCVIGGNSLGGAIAWNYASHFPERVKKLILIDALAYPTDPESMPIAFKLAETPVLKHLMKVVSAKSLAEKSVKDVYAEPSRVTPDLVDRYYAMYLREGNRQAFLDRMNDFHTPFPFERIGMIRMPTLIIWGDKDRLIPMRFGDQLAKDLPNDTLVVLKNIGHVPMEEDPTQTTEWIRKFLARN